MWWVWGRNRWRAWRLVRGQRQMREWRWAVRRWWYLWRARRKRRSVRDGSGNLGVSGPTSACADDALRREAIRAGWFQVVVVEVLARLLAACGACATVFREKLTRRLTAPGTLSITRRAPRGGVDHGDHKQSEGANCRHARIKKQGAESGLLGASVKI